MGWRIQLLLFRFWFFVIHPFLSLQACIIFQVLILVLQRLDEKGYTERKGYSGRIITDYGRMELEKGLIYDQVDFTFSKFEEKIYQTSFDYETKKGNVIVNTSNILDKEASNIIKKVFESGVCVSPLINEELGEINGKTGYIIKTICGTTIDGILLKNGIPTAAVFHIEHFYAFADFLD